MPCTRRFPRAGATALLMVALSSGCESLPDLSSVLDATTGTQELTLNRIADGLREALQVGSIRTTETLGKPDGFLKSVFHIPLPESLSQAREVGSRFGLGGLFDDVEVRLNRAAETGAPQARALLLDAIRQLTFQDVMAIYQGPEDAATVYLKRATAGGIKAQMRPIVADSLAEVGALQLYSDLARQYNRLPLVTPIDADLTIYVLGYATDAIFTQLAQEEALIRQDPLKRTTELLRQVFG